MSNEEMPEWYRRDEMKRMREIIEENEHRLRSPHTGGGERWELQKQDYQKAIGSAQQRLRELEQMELKRTGMKRGQ